MSAARARAGLTVLDVEGGQVAGHGGGGAATEWILRAATEWILRDAVQEPLGERSQVCEEDSELCGGMGSASAKHHVERFFTPSYGHLTHSPLTCARSGGALWVLHGFGILVDPNLD